MRSIVTLPTLNGLSTVMGEVDVYRDGDAVIVVGKGSVEKATVHGKVQTVVHGVQRYPNVASFEAARNNMKKLLAARLAGAPAAYTKLCERFDLDRDVSEAPPLPTVMRARLPPLLTGGSQ